MRLPYQKKLLKILTATEVEVFGKTVELPPGNYTAYPVLEGCEEQDVNKQDKWRVGAWSLHSAEGKAGVSLVVKQMAEMIEGGAATWNPDGQPNF